MNKELLFKEISRSVDEGIVTKDEIVVYAESLASNSLPGRRAAAERNSLVSKVLYIIGGIIAISGVLVFLGNNWDAIGFLGRWLVTVGLGLVTFVSAFLIHKKRELNILSQVFFTVSSVALFIGGLVWLSESTPIDLTGAEGTLLVSGLLLAVFLGALYAARKAILHPIATVFFTIAYYSLIFRLLDGTYFDGGTVRDIIVYSTMIIGMAYLAYGSWIRKMGESLADGHTPAHHRALMLQVDTSQKTIRSLVSLYTRFAFGGVLISALFLDDLWNLLYAFLAIGAISLSIKLRSTAALAISAVCIGIYCIKISVQYFSDSLSFPLILLLSGLLIIGLGYLTYYLNRKYISR